MRDDTRTGLWEGLGLAASHIVASPVGTLFGVVYLARDTGISLSQQGNFIALTFLALGAATILQAMRGRFVGSGFLAVSGFSTSYLPVLLAAAKGGGLPLVAGMTVFSGIIEIAIAPLLRYVRVLFPAAVLAVILALIGMYVGELGMDLLAGTRQTAIDNWAIHAIGGAVVLLIFSLTVWGTKQLRQMAVLIGLAVGYLILWGSNLIPADADELLLSETWWRWPALQTWSMSFDLKFVFSFALLPLIVAIRHIGLISTLQRETRTDWQEVDMANVARAQFASGLGTILSGMLGAGPTSIGSNSVALATQSKVTDRWIGILGGCVLILIGFCPFVYTLLLVIPDPLLGAVLLALGASMLVSALKLVDFRRIQPKDTLVLGTGLILGLHTELHSDSYQRLPEIIQDVTSSSMVVGVVAAAALNLFFLLGKKFDPSNRDPTG